MPYDAAGPLRSEQIYDALLDDEAFAALPELLARSIGARSSTIQWRHRDGSAAMLGFSDYIPADMVDRYIRDFVQDDVWAQMVDRPEMRDRVLNSSDLMPDSVLLGSRFYNEFIRAADDDSFYCLGIAMSDRLGEGMVGLHRGRHQPRFDRWEAAMLEEQVPHLRRLLKVRGRIEAAAHAKAQMGNILDAVSLATIAVDSGGRLVHANAAGERLLASATGLGVREGQVVARNGQGEALRAAVQRATAARQPEAQAVAIPLLHGGTLFVTVAPLLGPDGRRQALLLVQNAGPDPSVAARLRALYGLTAAEADISLMIADGLSVAEMAERRGTSTNTIRYQVKTMAAKIGRSRQTEIAHLVHALPPLVD